MQWHAPKKAFRPAAGLTSYAQRTKERAALAQMKAKEKEMKQEKEEERQVCGLFALPSTGRALFRTHSLSQRRIQAIRDKRAKKEERERYEKMAEKMHRKRVERLKRKEKRNKLLNS